MQSASGHLRSRVSDRSPPPLADTPGAPQCPFPFPLPRSLSPLRSLPLPLPFLFPLAPVPACPPAVSTGPRHRDSVVVDTCVLIAGLPTASGPGPWARIVEGMRRGDIVFKVSPALMREYRGVLARPAIAGRLRLGAGGADALLDDLSRAAQHSDPLPASPASRPPPDPGDAHLWALLRSDERLRLLTLDRALLERGRMRRRVITPAAWWSEREALAAQARAAGTRQAPGDMPPGAGAAA